MGKSYADKDSTGVCAKFYNAVAGSPAFQAIRRKSGPAQSSIVTNSADSNQLALHRNSGNANITRVSVAPKETVAHWKAGPARVSVDIQLEPPMVANPPVSSQKSGGVTISPSPSARKDDAAKSTIVFVHIQGSEDVSKPVRGQGINVSPGAKPTKTVLNIHIEGVQANQKSAVPKIHPDAEQVPSTDIFSDYISQVKSKMNM